MLVASIKNLSAIWLSEAVLAGDERMEWRESEVKVFIPPVLPLLSYGVFAASLLKAPAPLRKTFPCSYLFWILFSDLKA